MNWGQSALNRCEEIAPLFVKYFFLLCNRYIVKLLENKSKEARLKLFLKESGREYSIKHMPTDANAAKRILKRPTCSFFKWFDHNY